MEKYVSDNRNPCYTSSFAGLEPEPMAKGRGAARAVEAFEAQDGEQKFLLQTP
jgi:hypothetical protein